MGNSAGVPRHVISNFARFCDAYSTRDLMRVSGLRLALRRSGFEATAVDVGPHRLYRLRRLE